MRKRTVVVCHSPLQANTKGMWYTNSSEKYEFVSWDDYPIYEMEKQFETTNKI